MWKEAPEEIRVVTVKHKDGRPDSYRHISNKPNLTPRQAQAKRLNTQKMMDNLSRYYSQQEEQQSRRQAAAVQNSPRQAYSRRQSMTRATPARKSSQSYSKQTVSSALSRKKPVNLVQLNRQQQASKRPQWK